MLVDAPNPIKVKGSTRKVGIVWFYMIFNGTVYGSFLQ